MARGCLLNETAWRNWALGLLRSTDNQEIESSKSMVAVRGEVYIYSNVIFIGNLIYGSVPFVAQAPGFVHFDWLERGRNGVCDAHRPRAAIGFPPTPH